MKNLKVWQKLALMGAVFMLPFAVVTGKMASSVNTLGVEFARQEIRGLNYYTPALTLLRDLQQHRGMAFALSSGDGSFKERLARKGADIDNDIKNVEDVDRRLDATLHTTKKWTAVSVACRALLNADVNLSRDDAFDRHTKVIGEVIALIAAVADASNLTLDPDIDSYYLMNVLIFQGPELSDSLAQARGLGTGLIAGRNTTP